MFDEKYQPIMAQARKVDDVIENAQLRRIEIKLVSVDQMDVLEKLVIVDRFG